MIKAQYAKPSYRGGGTCPEGHGFDSFADDIGTIGGGDPSPQLLTTRCKTSTLKYKNKMKYLKLSNDIPCMINPNSSSISDSNFRGYYQWTDGDNIYITFQGQNTTTVYTYLLLGETEQGNSKYKFCSHLWSWSSSEYIFQYGNSVYTDGDTAYYYNTSGYQLHYYDKIARAWKLDNRIKLPSTFYGGDYVWHDCSGNTYYSYNGSSFKYDKETKSWVSISITNTPSTTMKSAVWDDGINTYCSYYSGGNRNLVLDEDNMTWINKSWNITIQGRGYIWKDADGDCYHTYYQNSYKLNKDTGQWESITFNQTPEGSSFAGNNVVVHNGEAYYIKSGYTYKFIKSENSWQAIYAHSAYGIIANNLWTDGSTIYYSEGTTSSYFSAMNYYLDKTDKKWKSISWNGISYSTYKNMYGEDIWSDGDNIYWSYSGSTYVFDKENLSWTYKSWTTPPSNMSGKNIWTDGINIFYNGTYVLDKENSTWNTTSFSNTVDGSSVWSDSKNMYCTSTDSSSTPTSYYTYLIDISTKRYKSVLTDGYSFHGSNVWTDGESIYANAYKINLDTSSSYIYLSYNGYLNGVAGRNVWTDGEKLFCTISGATYEITDLKVDDTIDQSSHTPSARA